MNRNRQFRVVLVALLLAVLAAGCAPQATPTPKPAPKPTTAPAKPTEPPPPEENVITFGCAVSFTGAKATEGMAQKDGMDFWVDWTNSHGGINVGGKPYDVEVVYYDDESDAQTAAKLTEKLITEDDTKLLFGPYSSALTIATAAIGEKYGAITMATLANSGQIYNQGYQNVFSVLPPAGNYLRLLIEMAVTELDPKPETVAILALDDPFGLACADGTREWAEEAGLEVLLYEKYPADTKDLSSLLTKVKGLNPDMVLSSSLYEHSVLITRQAKELDLCVPVLGFTVGPNFADFITSLGPDAEGVMCSEWWLPNMGWTGPIFGDSMQWAAMFEERYGYVPSYHSAAGSAGGVLFQFALEAAGTLEIGAVRDAMAALDVQFFWGPHAFNEKGQNIKGGSAPIQIQNGKLVPIYPPELAQAKPIYPFTCWDEREAREVITFGCAVSFTGAKATEGMAQKDGMDFWVDWTNSHGGINVGGKPYDVEVVYYDDESDAQTAAKLTEKLITEDDTKLLFGPYSSALTIATAAIGEKYGAITMATLANSGQIYNQGYQNVFSVLPPAGNYLRLLIEMAVTELDPKPETVAILALDDPFGLACADGTREWAEEAGLEVLLYEKYPADTKDLSSLLTKVKGLNPDMVLSSSLYEHSVLITRQAKELDLCVPVLGFTVGPNFADFITSLGPDAEGVMCSEWWLPNMGWTGPIFGDSMQWAAMFEERYGYVPSYHSAAGSAGGVLFQFALEAAGTLEIGAVRDAMAALDVQFFWGPHAFNEKGQNIKGGSAPIQIQNGKLVPIYPPELAQAKPIYPFTCWDER